jgi:hypothetical protein
MDSLVVVLSFLASVGLGLVAAYLPLSILFLVMQPAVIGVESHWLRRSFTQR